MERLDLVIFGATGFTGKQAVEKAVRLAEQYPTLTWGVAGRSETKLWQVVNEVSKKTGLYSSNIELIIADTNDEDSLKKMCRRAKVVVNCTGPYLLHGEPVVRACVDCKTHYIDVCAEILFLGKIKLDYDARARDAGVYVVSACGLDCVANDMGVVYLQENFNGTLNSVESYTRIRLPMQYSWQAVKNGTMQYGTWQSMVLTLTNWSELKSIKQKICPQSLPRLEPRLQTRLPHKDAQGYNIPIGENFIVNRTQHFLSENYNNRPVQFRSYVTIPWISVVIGLAILFPLWYIMSQFTFTRKLLLHYPRLFSVGAVDCERQTEEVLNNSHIEITLYGEGWSKDVDLNIALPNEKAAVKVTALRLGYGATATAAIVSAITVLKEQDKMPSTGGVLTTGEAFHSTSFVNNLNENNFKFELIH